MYNMYMSEIMCEFIKHTKAEFSIFSIYALIEMHLRIVFFLKIFTYKKQKCVQDLSFEIKVPEIYFTISGHSTQSSIRSLYKTEQKYRRVEIFLMYAPNIFIRN